MVATLVLIGVNFLSNTVPFGGNTMAEVSAKYPTFITPAGYAFSIWGLIYLLLLVFSIFQLRRGRESRFYNLIWPFYMLNVAANIAWLFAFQYNAIGISVVIMLILLYSLIRIFGLFYRFKSKLGTTRRFFFQVPFSLYFGWVSVATIVNIAVFLYSLDVAVFMNHQHLFAIAMVIVAAVLGLAILLSRYDYVFTLAVTWALVAIWIEQDSLAVETTAKFAAVGLIATMIYRFAARRVKLSRYGRKRASLNQ